MLRDADPSSFSTVYLICGYTDIRYGMDTLAAIIEQRYHLPLFVPDTLFLFCGRSAGNKSYMWVYCTGESEKHPIVLYNYRSTRKTNHPHEFLLDYSRILVTDGYHSLEKQKNDLRVAGCRVHAKRKYAELVKSTGISELEGTIAAQVASMVRVPLFSVSSALPESPELLPEGGL